MASPVAVLDILVRANTGAASAQLTTLDRQLKGTAATANATSTSLGSRLAKGAKYGALAMGALGAVSVKTAVDFDKSMRNVNSIAQLSEKQLAKLEDQVKSLAGRTAQSPQTLAEGLYDLVSSGFDANESMKVLAASAKAATAGLTTTEVSTKAVAASLNAYRMPASRAKQVSDILFRTVDRGVVSFEELSSTIGDVLPFASSLGVKLEEVGAATATMTKAGISPAETMTRLKAIMSSLLKPSEALTATLRQMGYESGEQIIKAKGLEGTLLALAKATGGSKTEMAALFPNIRALGSALALTGENAGAAKKDLDQLRDSAGATNRAFSEQSKAVSHVWAQLKVDANNLAIDIGDKVLPALREMLEILTDKKLTLDEKISKLGVRLTKAIEEWAPKAAEAGGKVGLAIIKGIWDAFWHSDLLGKLFIGAAALRLFGGPGVFSKLGGTIATKIGVGMKGGFGGMGSVLGAGLVASIAYAVDQKMREVREGGTKLDLVVEKMVDTWRRYREKVAGITGDLKDRFGSLTAAVGAMSEKQQKAYRKAALIAVRNGDITINEWQAMTRALDNVENRQQRMWERAAKVTGQKTSEIKKDVGDMTVKVSRSYNNMVEVTGSGIDWLMKNTSSAMKALGLKQELHWNLQRHKTGPTGGGYGNQSRMHGGPVKSALVPGTGSGDKVPLHIGGQLAAMVEPNELVSVTNRTATAALMAHNRRVPRRAQGGMVDPAGPGTGLVNEAIAGIVGRWSQRFNAAINYGYDPGGGHLSPGHNVTGTATDTGPAGGWGAGPTRLFEQGLKLLLGSGLTVLYGSHGIGTPYRNHGYGNHAHIEWGMHPVIKGLGAAAAETIKRILLKGPKGPLRDMGQSALDKTRKAANAYLAKHSGGMMGGDIGAPIRSLPEALQKYNRTYAEHNSAEGDWGGYRMPFNAVAALAEWAGAPGVSMARTAIGESNLRPGATGVDPGGTKGYGLWMITTSFNDDLVKPYGGYGQMLNPVLNAQVMNKILDRQGIGAWYSSTKDTSGTHYSGPLLRKHGGLVPHLAKGGKAGDKDLHGTATPGPVTNAFKRFRKARRIAKQLKDLLGERGRVARVDERIANAEALAGLASSEAGSEMGPKELARQIRLNELLLANLVKARKLARSGLGLTRWPKGMSVDKRTEGLMKGLAGGFRSNLVDLTGLTGSGGRIFETKNIIDELKHTTGAGPAALDISGLRSVIEAARYGVFDGYFARGGNLKPGRWGIAGERGPEVVHGPSTVLSSRATQDVLAPKVEVHNEFDFDGLDLYVTTKVNGEIAKQERIRRKSGRQVGIR